MQQRLSAAVMAAILLTGGAAWAQKSADTMRVAVYQPIRIVDQIFNPHPETTLLSLATFDTLVHFDAESRTYTPLLAESWSQPDAKTYEFKLRKGVKFHDGSDFDADDVVYSVRFVIDPKVNFRFKGTRFGWIEGAEKVDSHTVRIHAKRPYAAAMSRIASSLPIYPSDVHRALKEKQTFGRKPVGTGPLKVVAFDAGRGEVVFERNTAFTHGGKKMGAGVKRLIVSSIADRQTQVSRLLAGQQDLVWNVPVDMANSMRAHPDLELSVQRTVSFTYMLFDSADRSKIGVFKDKRVREALMKAVDRKALVKAFLPKEHWNDKLQPAICHEWHIGCAFSTQPPTHDLAGARKLLAEAGHGKGFKLALTTWGPSIRIAEAVAGQLRRVGIEASVDSGTIGTFVKKRARGKVQTFVSLWDNGVAQPDIGSTVGFFLMKSSRNYMGDPALHEAFKQGGGEMNPEKRASIYGAAFDRVNKERYMMPLVPLPAVVLHRKNVRMIGGHKSPEGFLLNRLTWK